MSDAQRTVQPESSSAVKSSFVNGHEIDEALPIVVDEVDDPTMLIIAEVLRTVVERGGDSEKPEDEAELLAETLKEIDEDDVVVVVANVALNDTLDDTGNDDIDVVVVVVYVVLKSTLLLLLETLLLGDTSNEDAMLDDTGKDDVDVVVVVVV